MLVYINPSQPACLGHDGPGGHNHVVYPQKKFNNLINFYQLKTKVGMDFSCFN